MTKIKAYIWHSIKKLGNLRFAIRLLLYIACLSIIGTVIEQNHNIKFYVDTYSSKNRIFGIANWQIIRFLQLDHLYTSWWFIGLIIIFSSSLIVCTLSRQLPILRSAKQWKFYFNQKKTSFNFYNNTSLVSPSISTLVFILNQKNYHIFQQKNKIYAYNNLIGRVAPIFVHLSIIFLLLGVLLGFFGGMLIQEMIPIGETIHPQNIISSGKLNYLQQNITLHVHKFSIQYNLDNSIKQFISDISIHNGKNSKRRSKTLTVNSPIYFEGMTIYQTDWDIAGIRMKMPDNTILQAPCKLLKNKENKIWITMLQLSHEEVIFITIPDLTGQLYLYNSKGQLTNITHLHESIYVRNIEIFFEDLITRTGLQIKMDPGIQIVYIGFGILLISVLLSYTSYSQLLIIYDDEKSWVKGQTNRASLDFEEEVYKIKQSSLHTYTVISNKNKHKL